MRVCPHCGSEYYWRKSEKFRRSLIGKRLPAEYYAERDEIQRGWIALAESCAAADFTQLSGMCIEPEREFFAKWGRYGFPAAVCPPGFRSRWAEKNKVFERESSDFGL